MNEEKLKKQLEETPAELTDCQENYETLSRRLNESESVLRFYSNPVNYKLSDAPLGMVHQNKLPTDLEHVSGNTFVAGKRAREYFKRYIPISDS